MEASQDTPLEVRAEPPAEKPKLEVVEEAARHNLHQLKEAATEALKLMGETASIMEPVEGCHPLFSAADFAARMTVPAGWKEGDPYPEYKGTANSIFALSMGDAIAGAPVSSHEVRSYQAAHFSKVK